MGNVINRISPNRKLKIDGNFEQKINEARSRIMIRVAVAVLTVVLAVEGGVLRRRLSEAIPSADDFLSAISSMAKMKLSDLASDELPWTSAAMKDQNLSWQD